MEYFRYEYAVNLRRAQVMREPKVSCSHEAWRSRCGIDDETKSKVNPLLIIIVRQRHCLPACLLVWKRGERMDSDLKRRVSCLSFSFLSIEWRRAIRTSLSRRVWCSSFVRSSQRFYPCRNVRAHVAVVVRDIFLRMCVYVPLIVGRARETIDLNLSLELTVGCIGFGRSTEFSFLDSSTMTFTWDAKNNFILSHGVTLYQPQASTADKIHWPSIVNEIRLEISSTPSVICWPDGLFAPHTPSV